MVDQLFTFSGLLDAAWEFAVVVYTCFVDVEKAYERVPQVVLWGTQWEFGVPGPLLQFYPCINIHCHCHTHC